VPDVSYQLASLGAGQFALTTIENGHGHVTATPPANRYTNGQVVTLTPSADAGQEFTAWSGGASGSQNPFSVTMTSNKVITANFTKRPSLQASVPLDGLVEAGFPSDHSR